MTDQAKALRGLKERGAVLSPSVPSPREASGARTIAVASGKGGVGKSNIALSLSVALAEMDDAVCLLDANLGLGNIDLLCGLNGYWNLSHVVTGARRLSDVVLDGPDGIHVIPGASGLSDLADCPPAAQQEILHQLQELEQTHQFLIIDTGSGIHRLVREFLMPADVILIVTTPEPTAIADAYATIKSLSAAELPEVQVLVNQADSSRQAHAIMERLRQTARLFLRTEVSPAGFVPRDPCVPSAVARRSPFLLDSPRCPAAQSVRQLARRLKHLTENKPSQGAYFPRMWQNRLPGAASLE